ncbi:MAG: PorT family protein [Prevotella sp.]|nr:PorT family protein [Prevotella sp.]
MKKVFAVIAALVLAVPSFAQYSSGGFDLDKENLYYGVRIGMNGATLSGDIDGLGTKVGLNIAGIIGLHISKTAPVFLESGLYYTERGGKKDKISVGYNNIEIPLLVKYGFKASDGIAVLPFLGPTFSYAISGKTKQAGVSGIEKVGTFDEKKAFTGGLKRANMGFKLGCGAEFNNIYLEGGYQFGITDVCKLDEASIHSNAFFLNFGVNF